MGGAYSQSANNNSLKKHQETLRIFTDFYYGTLMLICYVDFVAFMENPEKTWNDMLAKEMQKAPPEPTLFD